MTCLAGDYLCLVNNCSGAIGSGNLLFNYWQQNNCPNAYSQTINSSTSGAFQYNPTSQQFVQDRIVNLFNTYFITNTLTDNVTSPSYNNFQNTLLNLCIDRSLPGVCTQFLNGYCSQFTRDQVINSPTLTNFCGCYTPPDPAYLSLTLGSSQCLIGATGCTAGCTAGNTGCTGQPSCDPLCRRALTSQKAYQPTGSIITCPQNICVIDNVSINISQSNVPGGVNFNTVCSGCGGPSGGPGCLCIVSGVNISETASSIGIGANFNTFCSGSSICIVEDSSGNIISQGSCTGVSPSNIPVGTFPISPNIAIVFILVLIVFIVLFVVIAARFSVPKIYTTPRL